MYKYLLAAALALPSFLLRAQGSLLPLGDDNYPLLDRLEISSGRLPAYNSSLRGFTRGSAVQYALTLDSLPGTTASQRQDLTKIFTNNNEWLGICRDVQTLGSHKEGRYERVEGSDSLYRFIPHSQLRQSQQDQHYYGLKQSVLFNLQALLAGADEHRAPALALLVMLSVLHQAPARAVLPHPRQFSRGEQRWIPPPRQPLAAPDGRHSGGTVRRARDLLQPPRRGAARRLR